MLQRESCLAFGCEAFNCSRPTAVGKSHCETILRQGNFLLEFNQLLSETFDWGGERLIPYVRPEGRRPLVVRHLMPTALGKSHCETILGSELSCGV